MDFIDVAAARLLLQENAFRLSSHTLPLLETLGTFTAEDIYAPIDIPNFDNAAMDGFCFKFSDFEKQIPLKVKYTIQAGASNVEELKQGEAARIFTGAPIPHGADTVVMQEKIVLENDSLLFTSLDFIQGSNIRAKASQTKEGALIVSKHTKINAGIIGFLAGFGIQSIEVFMLPRVGICCTGNELVAAGTPLSHGQIYESNAISLNALLQEIGITPIQICTIEDDETLIANTIKKMLPLVDVLIMSGGISVGAFDFVQNSLIHNEVEKIFYKVKQKPGKPLFVGKKKDKLVFALPGNPAATFTCFHMYVKPFIQYMMGAPHMYDVTQKAPLLIDFNKKGSLTHFVKAHYHQGGIKILHGQESYKMDAFLQANCIVTLDSIRDYFKVGDLVPYILI